MQSGVTCSDSHFEKDHPGVNHLPHMWTLLACPRTSERHFENYQPGELLSWSLGCSMKEGKVGGGGIEEIGGGRRGGQDSGWQQCLIWQKMSTPGKVSYKSQQGNQERIASGPQVMHGLPEGPSRHEEATAHHVFPPVAKHCLLPSNPDSTGD